jgi:hypothetical protein
MKLAWICYDHYNDVKICFEEPEDWLYSKIVPIVYAVLEN